jgi:hypothetical protein
MPSKSVNDSRRKCFVVSAFGSTPEEQNRCTQVLRHLIEETIGERYEVFRADQIDDEGLITNQIITHLLEDDLVVADLTGNNPNVFYEIAVRHAARKPIVHLYTAGESIPFDVGPMRAVPYALDDPDVLEEAQRDLANKVKAIEQANWEAAPNPVSAARDVWLLKASERPDDHQAADVLAMFNQIQDELRSLARKLEEAPESQQPGSVAPKRLEIYEPTFEDVWDVFQEICGPHDPSVKTGEIAQALARRTNLPISRTQLRSVLEQLQKDHRLEECYQDVWWYGATFSG